MAGIASGNLFTMPKESTDDKFGPEETERRVEAALRGARISGHKEMKEIRAERKSETSKAVKQERPKSA